MTGAVSAVVATMAASSFFMISSFRFRSLGVSGAALPRSTAGRRTSDRSLGRAHGAVFGTLQSLDRGRGAGLGKPGISAVNVARGTRGQLLGRAVENDPAVQHPDHPVAIAPCG